MTELIRESDVCVKRGIHRLLLLISFCELSLSNACKVHISDGVSVADCRFRNLKAIPTSVYYGVNVLRFSDNQLLLLDNGRSVFREYEKLQEVFLARNMFLDIPEETFRGLDRLQVVDLDGNKLENLPKSAFRWEFKDYLSHVCGFIRFYWLSKSCSWFYLIFWLSKSCSWFHLIFWLSKSRSWFHVILFIILIMFLVSFDFINYPSQVLDIIRMFWLS